jgi:predicted acetyltransferase
MSAAMSGHRPASVHVRRAGPEDRGTVENLLNLYLYDIAEFANDGWRVIGPDGRYGHGPLDEYFDGGNATAFLVTVGPELAGFALVDTHVVLAQPAGTHSVAEFFIMRKYRRMGVGRSAAVALFGLFGGPWEVAQDERNARAQRFWRSVVDDYTGAAFSSELVDEAGWHGPVLSFQARRVLTREGR